MPSHIRFYLSERGFTEQMVPEQVILLIVQDNVDVACEAIEKAAMDRAVREIDVHLMQSYEARRRHRELRGAQSFWDPHAMQIPFIAGLPDPLRIKPNGLQAHQLRVYEDFGRFQLQYVNEIDESSIAVDTKRRVATRPGSAVPFARPDSAVSGAYSASGMPDHQLAATNASALAQEQFTVRQNRIFNLRLFDKFIFQLYITKLEAVLSNVPYPSLSLVPPNHEIRQIILRVLSLTVESGDRIRTPLIMSQKIVQHLYKTATQLGREIYVALLEQLCKSYEEVEKEAIHWLVSAEDERKFNIPVTITLLRSGLITVTDEDIQLAKWLYANASPRPNLQDFAANLIRDCLTHEPPIAHQTQFQYSIDALVSIVKANKATETCVF